MTTNNISIKKNKQENFMQKVNKHSGVQVNSWNDVNYQIAELREKEVQILAMQRAYDDEVLALQKKYMDPKQQFKDEAEFIKGRIKDFCDAHREEMEDSKKKELANGEVSYRKLPPKLKCLENHSEDSVIKKIIKLGKSYIQKFIRTKTELDINSLKKEFTERRIDEKFLKKLGLEPVIGEGFNIKPNP